MARQKADRRSVIENLLLLAEKSIIESELKEIFVWGKALEAEADGNEKGCNEFKMKFAAQKRDRQDSYEPWRDLLEKELSTLIEVV